MSAYDNPTIIRDDSAMIYAQMLGTAGQTFTESFKTARKEREAKEKEERLEAEKKAKESKEVQLNKQLYSSNTIKLINAETEQTRTDLSKVGAPPPITDQAVKFELAFKNIFGENAQKIKFDEVTPEFIEADAKLQSEYNTVDANLKRIIGEGGSQVKEGAEGALNQTNASARYFRGGTNAQRLRELAAFNGFVLNKDITPDLVYDKKNFKGAALDVKITGYDTNKLKTAMGTIDPNVIKTDENWNIEFLKRLQNSYNMNDSKCELCNKEVPAEGLVVRIENLYKRGVQMTKNNMMIVKSNKLINQSYKLGTVEKKLIYYLITQINNDDDDFTVYSMRISDFLDLYSSIVD
jgi:hypothetical protein